MTCEKCCCPKCAKFQVEGRECSCSDCKSGEYTSICTGFVEKKQTEKKIKELNKE